VLRIGVLSATKEQPKVTRTMQKVRLEKTLATFTDHWNPRIVGELNGQHVKLVKFRGEFVWHHHVGEDEMFLVVHGSFRMDYRDPSGCERSLEINEGEFVIVPRGIEHRPYAAEECHVLLFEPTGTLNTGNVRNDQTVENPVRIVEQ
jgi:mannose-6-phosphate isomerase-like protein (cupin superfamily)